MELAGFAVVIVGSVLAASPLETEIRAVPALAGEPRIVSAAGVTRDETPILTIENPDAFDAAATKRRLVLVGGAAEGSAEAVVAAVRWFKTSAPRSLTQQWTVSALPAASFEPADTQSLARWITFQAPDLVVTVGRDPVQAPMLSQSIDAADAIRSLEKLMTAARGIDVCPGTGAGPTRRYYFDRPAVTGADDRGGAMALLAALEMHELENMGKSARH